MPKAPRSAKHSPPSAEDPSLGEIEHCHHKVVRDTARRAGLLRAENGRIAGRIRETLPQTAKAQSGLTSDTELLEYGLATVALEDNFGPKILARKGPISDDIHLKF